MFLTKLGAKKTRDIAERLSDLQPMVVLFAKCHELLSGEKVRGAERELAGEVAASTLRRAGEIAVGTVNLGGRGGWEDRGPWLLWRRMRGSGIRARGVVALGEAEACATVDPWVGSDRQGQLVEGDRHS
jgi:hypothetical protein